MRKCFKKVTYILFALALFAASVTDAQADDGDYSSDSTGLWQGSAEFGFRKTSGNTKSSNIHGKLNLVQNLTYWRNTYTLQSSYATADETTTSELYRGSIQSDYKYNNKEFLFVRAETENDQFSGYRSKSNLSSGYGNRLWQGIDGSYLEASVGLGYRRDELKENEESTNANDFDIGFFTRFNVTIEKYISDTTTFTQKLNSQVDMEYGNNETESITSLQTDIISNVAMKVSYRAVYDSQVPEDNAHTNTETSVTFLYSF